LAAYVKDRIFNWREPADVSLSRSERLHADNQPPASNDVLEALSQDRSAYCLIAFTPWFGHQPAYLIGHQDRAPRRITSQHPHFREDPISDEFLPFLAY
jgi:hypothetical protein